MEIPYAVFSWMIITFFAKLGQHTFDLKQGRKRPLDTPERNVERRERERE